MTVLDVVKNNIRKLYETNPNIHVNRSIAHPRLQLQNDPAVIKSVYPHVFRIEEYSSGTPECHTLKYADILTHQIEIIELIDMIKAL